MPKGTKHSDNRPKDGQQPPLIEHINQWIKFLHNLKEQLGPVRFFCLVIVALLVVLAFQGKKVCEVSVIDSICTWASREWLPTADRSRFAVAVAHLDGDKDQRIEFIVRRELEATNNQIARDLSEPQFATAQEKVDPIQILLLDRIISLKGLQPQEAEDQGLAEANEYLRKTGADVLIWGTVVSTPDNRTTVPEIYWTISPDTRRTRYFLTRYPIVSNDLRIPELSHDLGSVIKLLAYTSYLSYTVDPSVGTIDQLRMLTNKIRTVLKGEQASSHVHAAARADLEVILATSLTILAEQKQGDSASLNEAIELLRGRLASSKGTQRAVIYNNLASALVTLGQFNKKAEYFRDASENFKRALEEWTSMDAKLQTAVSKHNLGTALMNLGRMEVEMVRDLQDTYKRVLSTRAQAPVEYPEKDSCTIKQLADEALAVGVENDLRQVRLRALNTLGRLIDERTYEPFCSMDQLENDAKNYINKAVEMLREAIDLFKREEKTKLQALATYALGNALMILAEIVPNADIYLKQAEASYEEAVEVLSSDEPWPLALSYANLGAAQMMLANLQKDSASQCKGIVNIANAANIADKYKEKEQFDHFLKDFISQALNGAIILKECFTDEQYDDCLYAYADLRKDIWPPRDAEFHVHCDTPLALERIH